MHEVAVDVSLVDRIQRPEPHRHCRVLPEVRHASWVGIARDPVGRHFLPEAVELLLCQPALYESPGVNPRRRVTLEEDLVAGAAVGLASEEMVEPDLVERSGARVRRQVAADPLAAVIGSRHHDRGVPTDGRTDPPFEYSSPGNQGSKSRGIVFT